MLLRGILSARPSLVESNLIDEVADYGLEPSEGFSNPVIELKSHVELKEFIRLRQNVLFNDCKGILLLEPVNDLPFLIIRQDIIVFDQIDSHLELKPMLADTDVLVLDVECYVNRRLTFFLDD